MSNPDPYFQRWLQEQHQTEYEDQQRLFRERQQHTELLQRQAQQQQLQQLSMQLDEYLQQFQVQQQQQDQHRANVRPELIDHGFSMMYPHIPRKQSFAIQYMHPPNPLRIKIGREPIHRRGCRLDRGSQAKSRLRETSPRQLHRPLDQRTAGTRS